MDSNSTTAQHLIMAEAVEALGLREKLIEMGWVPPKEAALLMADKATGYGIWIRCDSLAPPEGVLVIAYVAAYNETLTGYRDGDSIHLDAGPELVPICPEGITHWMLHPRLPDDQQT